MVKVGDKYLFTFKEYLEQNPDKFKGLSKSALEDSHDYVVYREATFNPKEQAKLAIEMVSFHLVDPIHMFHVMVCYTSKDDMSDYAAVLLVAPELVDTMSEMTRKRASDARKLN